MLTNVNLLTILFTKGQMTPVKPLRDQNYWGIKIMLEYMEKKHAKKVNFFTKIHMQLLSFIMKKMHYIRKMKAQTIVISDFWTLSI